METLHTSLEQFERLHKIVDGARANARNLKVDRTDLANLLMDHSTMLKILGRSKVIMLGKDE